MKKKMVCVQRSINSTQEKKSLAEIKNPLLKAQKLQIALEKLKKVGEKIVSTCKNKPKTVKIHHLGNFSFCQVNKKWR